MAGGVAAIFGSNHPGGAIGATYKKPQTVRDVMVPYEDITCLSGSQVRVGGDVLKAAYVCKTGWLRVGEDALGPDGQPLCGAIRGEVSDGILRVVGTAHMLHLAEPRHFERGGG